MTFCDLKLIPQLLQAVEKEGYTTPSPIQEQAIPYALQGRDILGCAQTGTGKTAAFALPILQKLYETSNFHEKTKKAYRPVSALILTPTRELAIQIGESFESYGQFSGLRTTVIFGGVPQRTQTHALSRGVDILVATPGRLNDLIGQGLLDFSFLQFLVLDEADRMLDMGFFKDVKKILNCLPKEKQTLFFSATMPEEVRDLVDSLLLDPVKIVVNPVCSTVDAVRQVVYKVDKANKKLLLPYLLETQEIPSVLVFTRTKRGADMVARRLSKADIRAQSIHGDKAQNARQRALQSFKEGRTRVLVATDIAARGIDIDGLPLVINYDLPETPEAYVHRIGRTGRAGLSGTAVSFCSIDEESYMRSIVRHIKKEIEEIPEHPYPMQQTTLQEKERPSRGNAGKKGSFSRGRPGNKNAHSRNISGKRDPFSRGTYGVPEGKDSPRKNKENRKEKNFSGSRREEPAAHHTKRSRKF